MEAISETTGSAINASKPWPRVYHYRSSLANGSAEYVVCPEWLSIRSLHISKDESGNLFVQWTVHSDEPRLQVPLWRRLAREVSFWWRFG